MSCYHFSTKGRLSNDGDSDGDKTGQEWQKKQQIYIGNSITLHVHHSFLYTS